MIFLLIILFSFGLIALIKPEWIINVSVRQIQFWGGIYNKIPGGKFLYFFLDSGWFYNKEEKSLKENHSWPIVVRIMGLLWIFSLVVFILIANGIKY